MWERALLVIDTCVPVTCVPVLHLTVEAAKADKLNKDQASCCHLGQCRMLGETLLGKKSLERLIFQEHRCTIGMEICRHRREMSGKGYPRNWKATKFRHAPRRHGVELDVLHGEWGVVKQCIGIPRS